MSERPWLRHRSIRARPRPWICGVESPAHHLFGESSPQKRRPILISPIFRKKYLNYFSKLIFFLRLAPPWHIFCKIYTTSFKSSFLHTFFWHLTPYPTITTRN